MAQVREPLLPKLGDRKIKELTLEMIRTWYRGVATAPPRLGSAVTAEKRRVRILAPDDADAWRRVKPFEKVQVARIRYLTDDETTRLVNACPPDLRRLVIGALLTGCRYQELATLRPFDVDWAVGVLNIRASKAGGFRSVVLTQEAVEFFRQGATGKAPSSLLSPRFDGLAWGKSHQFRPLRAIPTAARTGEVIGAHWSEIDMQAAMWTVPAARMKASREHRVRCLTGRCTCCGR